MLRLDLPSVWSNVTRWEAFVNFLVCAAALLWSPWLMGILVLQGFVRGFLGHYKCPAHHLWGKLFVMLGWAGTREDAGAKMFANKILFVASTVSVVAHAMDSTLWKVPCMVLMVFTTLEWAFSFCAACYAYGLWYRKFPPKMM